ncbi:MAG: hypothetical protein METHP_00698 [Methanoregula sp. SKADARSKE-2]|nr:MAG: hypothetical protein METHP_00698 [Methanoregula sp. SKADARSKE-2]
MQIRRFRVPRELEARGADHSRRIRIAPEGAGVPTREYHLQKKTPVV